MDSGAAAVVAAVEAADALERLRVSIGLPAVPSRAAAAAWRPNEKTVRAM